ncbi:glycosyltransferase family 4 protein [Melioribacteraceae bacterium 4301-Me]|uniref:glycosyltransferase family 4 protein n=1 Tax=Pyranulibacter aquaticus TaxID=3163344 RepID=UPI0035972FFD
MKILVSCLSKSWGGMEMQTILTAEVLLQNKVDAEIFCYKNSKIYEKASSKKINVNFIKSSFFINPFQIFWIYRLLKRKKFDLIHSQASKDLWLFVPVIKFFSLKVPLLLTKHVGSYIVKKDIAHKWLYEKVSYAIAISEVIRKNLIETTTLSPNRVLLVHNGIDTNKFKQDYAAREKIRSEFNIGNKLVIGMSARFSPGKGHEEFLLAAKLLSQKYTDLIFIIVGEPSYGEKDYAEQIYKLANELNLKNKIIFTGYREDMPNVYSAMDIFVFPSHAEAFGLALVEAMSCGLPSVCTNSDGVLDIAIDGKTSYLFEKQDVNDLAHKIELLIESPEKRIEFGKQARKRAVEAFDIQIFVKKIIGIYNRTIN